MPLPTRNNHGLTGPRQRPRGRGFTLIEAALVTIIVSTGFLAMLGLISTGTSMNSDAAEITTAVNLSQNIKEMMMRLPYTDEVPPNGAPHPGWGLDDGETIYNCSAIDDLDGAIFSPAVDGARQTITSLPAGWVQAISVKTTVEGDISRTQLTPDPLTEPMARVTCQIIHNGRAVHTQEWLVVNTKE